MAWFAAGFVVGVIVALAVIAWCNRDHYREIDYDPY